MKYRRLVVFSTALFLMGCSSASNDADTEEIIVGEVAEVEAETETKAEENEAAKEETTVFQLSAYEGEWEQQHEMDAPYLTTRIENIEGDTAAVYIDAMSEGARYIASAGQEKVLFQEGKAIVEYEDDGSGASGTVAVKLLEDEILLTVTMIQEGQPLWRLPDGEFRLERTLAEEQTAVLENEAAGTEEDTSAAPAASSAGETDPQSDEEYLSTATAIMAEFWEVMDYMITLYSFGSSNPGDYAIIEPHISHLVTAEFAEATLAAYAADYYCECDSGLLPGIDERLSNASIKHIDESTYQVIGDFLIDPMSPEPTSMTQVLEFTKQENVWKLNNWRFHE